MMNLWKITTTLTVMAVISERLSTTALSTEAILWQKPDLADVAFVDDLLFSSTTTSKRDCARLCSTRVYSLTYSFTTSSGECRCHSSYMTSVSTSLLATGTKVYTRFYIVWLETACSTNADCKGVNSVCYAGKCLCTPGYYYSISRNYCVDSCAVPDLQTTFLRYPNVAIPANNLYGGPKSTAQDCLDWCAADTKCKTAEWKRDPRYCIIAGVTALDVPESHWDTSLQDFDLYQRKCA